MLCQPFIKNGWQLAPCIRFCECSRSFTTFKTALPRSVQRKEKLAPDRNSRNECLKQKGKSHSSTIWLDRQLRDPYYLRAKEEGYRSRAVYKLKEINEKFGVFRKGDVIIDVGAAPGGWSQLASQIVGSSIPCAVVSVDLLDISPILGVYTLKGDFLSKSIQSSIQKYIGDRSADIVISDIAPNFSGNHSIDHLKQIDMCRSVVEFAKIVSKKECWVILKVLQGSEFQSFIREMKNTFESVKLIKPKASRKESTEIYCVMKSFRLF